MVDTETGLLILMFRLLVAALAVGVCLSPALAADTVEIKIGLMRRFEAKQTISLLDLAAENNGFAGAALAAEDNNTTGKFLGQHYTLADARLGPADDPAAALAKFEADGIGLIIADLPADALLKLADAAKGRDILIFNAGATDDSLREEDCRANVIHTAPTRSMLVDGLAQYLIWKRWNKWLLVLGSHKEDQLYAEAVRRSAKKFGGKIVEERVFEDTGSSRRSDTGYVQFQRQMPVFTQNAAAHDVLVVADESDVFGLYLPFRTWDARPVAGTAGLVAMSWDASFDQWGANQLQNRFIKLFSRRMTAKDIQAWTALRMIGEGASRKKSNDVKIIRDYILSPEMSVAAFKGQKLTLRDWNQQLRQPILLGDGRTIASVSPQEGFLHQVSELDTLGFDRPETKCKLR